MARITRISTDVARQVLHSLVARNDDQYHSKKVSGPTFKKEILNKAQGKNLGLLRGGQKFISRNQMKHSVKELAEEFLKTHPKFTVNRRAMEKIGVRAYDGSALREDFNNEEFLKKADRYTVSEQAERDKAKDTGPTKAELAQQARVQKMRQVLYAQQRNQERTAIASGDKVITPSSITESKGATSSVFSHAGAGTIAGASKHAGEEAASQAHGQALPTPGGVVKPVSENHPVQLAGGFGLYRQGPDRGSAVPGTSMPTVGTPDLRSPVTPRADSADAPPEDKADAPALPSKEAIEDIEKNLPLAP